MKYPKRALRLFLCAVTFLMGVTATGTPVATGQDVSVPEAWDPRPASDVGVQTDISRWVVGVAQLRAAYPWMTGAGYTLAVVDTGVDYTHPALSGRYVGGYDFVNNDADPQDDHGHGTHCAGISVGDHASYGGMAPGANYVALKVLNSGGSGLWSYTQNALDWLIANHAAHNIVSVNVSLGGGLYTTPVDGFLHSRLQTLKDAGVFVACAAGNDYYNEQSGGLTYPAADIAAVSVGSTWTTNFGQFVWGGGAIDYTGGLDRLVSHGQRDENLDILAPGAWIRSAAYNWEDGNPDWVDMGGTSMATPHIAGMALLVRQAIEHYWDEDDWPDDDEWVDTILAYLYDYGEQLYDGDDEDDNVTNSGLWYRRADIGSSVDAVIADTPVPEPATAVLLAIGSSTLVLCRRRRRKD